MVSPLGFQDMSLSLKVQEVAREVDEIVMVLEGEGQAIWTIARSSTAMKLDYHLALCYPSDMMEAAKEMDIILGSMLQSATGIPIPMHGRCGQGSRTLSQARCSQAGWKVLPKLDDEDTSETWRHGLEVCC